VVINKYLDEVEERLRLFTAQNVPIIQDFTVTKEKERSGYRKDGVVKLPNWCDNKLHIFGANSKELKRFEKFAKRPDSVVCQLSIEGDEVDILDFNNFISYPEKFAKADEARRLGLSEEDGYNHGGYGWCVSHWGTKWGACHVSSSMTKRSLFYAFDTAWAPPVPVIYKMAELFPKLEFHLNYAEAGCAFAGKLWVKGRRVLKDESGKYCGHRGG